MWMAWVRRGKGSMRPCNETFRRETVQRLCTYMSASTTGMSMRADTGQPTSKRACRAEGISLFWQHRPSVQTHLFVVAFEMELCFAFFMVPVKRHDSCLFIRTPLYELLGINTTGWHFLTRYTEQHEGATGEGCYNALFMCEVCCGYRTNCANTSTLVPRFKRVEAGPQYIVQMQDLRQKARMRFARRWKA